MENKTISELNKKAWYRLLKVIFIVALPIALLVVNKEIITYGYIFAWNWTWWEDIMLLVGGNLATLLIFGAIRRIFYYIVLGSLRPQK